MIETSEFVYKCGLQWRFIQKPTNTGPYNYYLRSNVSTVI